MPRWKNILFDLDGTLTDPEQGITRSIQYALEKLGIASPPSVELRWCIGPALRESFAYLLKSQEPSQIEQALSFYRERFSKIGIYENEPYPGISEILCNLASSGFSLFVATSKPVVYAEIILEHFSLRNYFARVLGPTLDGKLTDKAEVIQTLLEQESLLPQLTVMVGDREHDIHAAKKNGIESIGVCYGFGSVEELKSAGASYLVQTAAELERLLIDGRNPTTES